MQNRSSSNQERQFSIAASSDHPNKYLSKTFEATIIKSFCKNLHIFEGLQIEKKVKRIVEFFSIIRYKFYKMTIRNFFNHQSLLYDLTEDPEDSEKDSDLPQVGVMDDLDDPEARKTDVLLLADEERYFKFNLL